MLVAAVMVLLSISCQSKKQDQNLAQSADTTVNIRLSPLENGEIYLKDQNPFGEDIELKGRLVEAPDDFIFRPSEPGMVIRDSLLFMSSLNGPYYIFNYPELTYLKTIGRKGNGPDEFVYPSLFASKTPSTLCYLMEGTRESFYEVTPSLEMKPSSVSLNNGNKVQFSSSKEIFNVAPDRFYFVDNTKKGKAVFTSYKEKDSTVVREIYDLSFLEDQKSPHAYTGSFGINFEKNRMMYAYKYYKVLKFMDLEGKTVRTVNFAQNSLDDGTLKMTDGLDRNVTNYMAVCTTDKYVYVTYSGRTPMQVGKDQSENKIYMFVEQYDWNGNPIHRYRLDQFSVYVTMDKEAKMVAVLYYKDDPFCIFDFPEE